MEVFTSGLCYFFLFGRYTEKWVMKRLVLLHLILVFVGASFAQEVKKENLLKRKASHTKQFDTASLQPNQYQLRMDFSGYIIQNPGEFALHYGKQIDRIELYYTTFRVSDSFEQSALNGKRLDQLEKLIPEVYTQTGITWRFVAQTGAKTPEDAGAYFHGFVITYRDVTFIDRTTEIRMMDSVSLVLRSVIDTPTAIECRTITKTKRKWSGYYFPNNPRKLAAGKRYRHKGVFAKRKKDYILVPLAMTICDTSWGISGDLPDLPKTSDSTVTSILERNMKNWKNAAIVTDVTGSMYPYIMQLQIWFRLNFHLTDCRHFVFFNDGDNKMDGLKRMGNVGGVYAAKAGSYGAMNKLCQEAMQNGNGGDGQENNIEALLVAQKEFPECKEFILIADNYAPVRDMKLLDKVKRPVHVILCGTHSGYVNVEYLEIARRTGGTVHTMEKDIENLAELAEGSVIEIGGQKYQIRKGEFVWVTGT